MNGLELARFALYVDLGVAFGVPAAALLTRTEGFKSRRIELVATLLGLPLSIFAYLLTVAEMAGTGLADLDWHLANELVTTTAVGWAFLVRSALLVVASTICLVVPTRTWWRIAPIAVTLVTLAWSGHAAASEGAIAFLRLATDMVHLLAAAIWLGALVLFLALLYPERSTQQAVAASLERFAGVGSILVGMLALTGLGNLWFLVSPTGWPGLLSTNYGGLLAVKLALLSTMLLFAALNRWSLVPSLRADWNVARNQRRLLFSIVLEFCAALAVLIVVSRLGMMDPG